MHYEISYISKYTYAVRSAHRKWSRQIVKYAWIKQSCKHACVSHICDTIFILMNYYWWPLQLSRQRLRSPGKGGLSGRCDVLFFR